MITTPSPWRLSATSWLWPKSLSENLRRISSWKLPISEVALLFYQHAPSLAYLPKEFEPGRTLASHVHLPLDLPWEDGSLAVWNLLERLMALPSALSPWGGVLHPPREPDRLAGLARLWREAAPGWRLMVENIPGQDLRDHWPVIREYGLPVCLDVGHLMAFDQDWLLDAPGLFDQVELLHCYAPGIVKQRHEHLSLAQLSPSQRGVLKGILTRLGPDTRILFEVFSESDLRGSLESFYALCAELSRENGAT
ncbi:MAG: cobamide remodeling phosphodiesterase CbiR [Acidobacteriota bacterium]